MSELSIEYPSTNKELQSKKFKEKAADSKLNDFNGRMGESELVPFNTTSELRYIKETLELESNQPNVQIGVPKDIAERRRLEDDLIKHNEHLRYIFDHLNVGIWMRESIEGDLVYASKGLAEILKISLETLYNYPDYWKGMVLPMYKEKLFEKYELLSKGKQINHMFRI